MNEQLVLPVMGNGKIKYLKQRKTENNKDLVLPIIENGKIKYLKKQK